MLCDLYLLLVLIAKIGIFQQTVVRVCYILKVSSMVPVFKDVVEKSRKLMSC